MPYQTLFTAASSYQDQLILNVGFDAARLTESDAQTLAQHMQHFVDRAPTCLPPLPHAQPLNSPPYPTSPDPMTYCVAIKLNAGLVFLSDSRTNAGFGPKSAPFEK